MRYLIATACLLAMIPGGVFAQQSGRKPAASKAAVRREAPKRAHRAPGKLEPRFHRRKSRHGVRRAKPRAKAAVETKPSAAIPAPVAPLTPPTLMHQTPVPAVVTLHDGLLTIDAPNCTLSEVLSSVGHATGASIEGITSSERVAVRLGPGKPRQVIAALLEGTPYNYIIIGSPQNPGAITRIMLSQAASGPEPNRPAPPQAVYHPPAEQPPPFPVRPGGIVNGAVIQQPRPVQSPQPKPPANSPEQLFQQLLHPQPRQPLAPK
jgi:hypothetical protein